MRLSAPIPGWALGVLALVVGCSAGSPPADQLVVRDSAGVRIVEHRAIPAQTAFDVVEVYSFGQGAGEHQFVNLWSGTILSDGVAVVGDAGAQEVLAITPSGAVVDTLGREGEGPTELGRVLSVGALPGDTVVIEDKGHRRFVFVHRGEQIRSQPRGGSRLANPSGGVGVVGRRLISRPTSFPLFFDEEWLELPVTAHDLDSQQWDTLTTYAVTPRIERDRAPDPFRPWGYLGAGEDQVLIARGDRPEVRVHSPETGQLQQITRWPSRQSLSTPDEWERYEDLRRDGSAEVEAELVALRAAVVEPLPDVMEVRGDDAGRLWVGRFDVTGVPIVWDVFAATGESVGQVRLPERTSVLRIRGDLMLTAHRDELDVQAVVLYRLVPPEEP